MRRASYVYVSCIVKAFIDLNLQEIDLDSEEFGVNFYTTFEKVAECNRIKTNALIGLLTNKENAKELRQSEFLTSMTAGFRSMPNNV